VTCRKHIMSNAVRIAARWLLTLDELSKSCHGAPTALPATACSRCQALRSGPSRSLRTSPAKKESKIGGQDKNTSLGTYTPDTKRSLGNVSAIRDAHRCELVGLALLGESISGTGGPSTIRCDWAERLPQRR
jgi:hypothetical protein